MSDDKNPVVETVEGKLRGCVRQNLDGEDFYCFLGVKYAKPPLGDLRFKPPEPLEHWSGIQDASQEGEPFIQKDYMTGIKMGTEDALHLNVFTKKPIPDSTHLNPVMVWIHGGAFIEGRNSLAIHGPDFLMIEDIVLVIINYRIGVLGFLSFEDPSSKMFGNAGMKDQVEALKWVQRNINNFGGDPNNVTIFGESAGGASVHYHITSPLSEGLFHKAIMQSGCSGAFWAKSTTYVKEFMDFIGKGDLTDDEQLNYLIDLSVEELFEYHHDFIDSLPLRSFKKIAPIVEKPNDTAFIIQSPVDKIVSGNYSKVPILLGYNSNECMLMAADSIKDKQPFQDMSKIEIISNVFDINLDDQFVDKLNEVYPNEDDYYLFLSDLYFIMATISAARLHSRTSHEPVFLYRMSLSAGLNILKKMLKLDRFEGAAHVDDCGYLFNNAANSFPEKGTIEDISVRRFVKLWTNFSRFGNPTPEENELSVIWKPFDENNEYYLDIGTELILRNNPESKRTELWKEIFQAHPETANYM